MFTFLIIPIVKCKNSIKRVIIKIINLNTYFQIYLFGIFRMIKSNYVWIVSEKIIGYD